MNNFDFNNRSGRLLLVITILSALYFVFKILLKVMGGTFNIIYINLTVFGQEIPFGFEHVLVSFILGAVTIVGYHLLRYCFAEFHNFCEYDNADEAKNFAEKADSLYKLILGLIKYYGIIIFILIVILVVLLGETFWVYRLLQFAMLVTFAFFIRKDIKDYFNGISKTFLNKTSSGYGSLMSIWLIISIFYFLGGFSIYENSVDGKMLLEFKVSPKPLIDITLYNKTPEEMEIYILSEENKISNINENRLKEKDFHRGFIEVTNETNKDEIDRKNSTKSSDEQSVNKDDTKLIKYFSQESKYKYFKSVDVSDILAKDYNNERHFILITFKVKSISGQEKVYKLVNEIIKKDGNIIFMNDKVDFKI